MRPSLSTWYMDQLVSAGLHSQFVVLKYFMDESGIIKNPQGIVCSVGGFFANNRAWKTFSKRWASMLTRYKITEFHSKEFWDRDRNGGLVGEYRGKRFDDCNELLNEIIVLISKHDLRLLASVVDLEAFYSYSEQERRWLTGATFDQEKIRFLDSGKPNAPYFMPFQACVAWGVMLAADESEWRTLSSMSKTNFLAMHFSD